MNPGARSVGEVGRAFSPAQAQRAGDPDLSVEKFRTVMEKREHLLFIIMDFNSYIQFFISSL